MTSITAGKITGGILGFGVVTFAVGKIVGKIKDNIRQKKDDSWTKKMLEQRRHVKEVKQDDSSWRHKTPTTESIRKYAGAV